MAALVTALKPDCREGTRPGIIPGGMGVGIARGGIIAVKFRVARFVVTFRVAKPGGFVVMLGVADVGCTCIKAAGFVVTFRVTKVARFVTTFRVAKAAGLVITFRVAEGGGATCRVAPT